MNVKQLLLGVLPFAMSASAVADSAPAPTVCNFGPTHHSHLVLPLAATAAECAAPNATFVMSHGATFFCPHTFDVKLLATIEEDAARKTLCDTHFEALAIGVSSKMVLRPTLPAGGLPALARGELKTWQSPVMYHVHNFGKNNDAGPDAGWNVTTVRNATTTINVAQLLYGRLLDVQPKPASLTYLAHTGGEAGLAVLSHYISTSGSSGFDHILKADIVTAGASVNDETARIKLRDTWPTFLTITDRSDSYSDRLTSLDQVVAGELHTYDSHGLPTTVAVDLRVTLDYYHGTSDGFAGYGTMCPSDQAPPSSPTTCLSGL